MPKPFLLYILALGLLGGVLPPAAAQAQAAIACDEMLLDEANGLYDLGRFDETIEKLKPCLPGRFRLGEQHFRGRQATQALRLMALSSYAMRQPPDSTSQWVQKLVKLDRRYQADPEEDPLFFQYLVDDLWPSRWYQRRWVQIGGVLIVGGLVGCWLGGCFENEIQPLPGPPSDPPRGF